MDFCQILEPKQKALQINLDNKIYGTFAEIGAGQEVARNFFQAGGAAGTVAKTMSAYDMTFSDSIYGKEKSGRYVCQDRVMKMLDYEYDLLVDRLGKVRGSDTTFFVFADTVAAKSYSGKGECHGWLAVRFQHAPNAKASELLLHIRMLDQENVQQQEAVGLIGVNMIHACFFHRDDKGKFVSALMDNLSTRRIEIDMIHVSGEALSHMDSRILSLELVKRKYTKVVMFDENGKAIQARDYLYKKNLVVLRGSFRPPTHVNMDMLKCGLEIIKEEVSEGEEILGLPEVSMSKLIERGEVSNRDFLARVDLLTALKQVVMISNFANYFEVNEFLENVSRRNIIFVTGVYNLQEILDIKKYENCPSGILGGLGTLFGKQTKLAVYPALDDDDSSKLNHIDDVKYDPSIKSIVNYFFENQRLINVKNFNEDYSAIWSRTVLKMIEDGESGWEEMVPDVVAKHVKTQKLFSK